MRRIEQQMLEAIRNRKNFKRENTQVVWLDRSFLSVYLFDNCICEGNPDLGWITVSDCGWRTSTTKSRLNAVLSHYKLGRINQSKNVWYFNEERWNTSRIFYLNKEQM